MISIYVYRKFLKEREVGVEKIDAGTFNKNVIENRETAIVDFYADWCMPCKVFSPVFEEVSGDYEDKVKFYKIDVDKEADLAAGFDVMSIPTVVFFQGGEKKDSFKGSLPKDKFKAFMDKNTGE